MYTPSKIATKATNLLLHLLSHNPLKLSWISLVPYWLQLVCSSPVKEDKGNWMNRLKDNNYGLYFLLFAKHIDLLIRNKLRALFQKQLRSTILSLIPMNSTTEIKCKIYFNFLWNRPQVVNTKYELCIRLSTLLANLMVCRYTYSALQSKNAVSTVLAKLIFLA